MRRVAILGTLLIFLICSIVVLADTSVSGDITSDTTWGRTSPDPNGIYIVTGDITIRNGATLTIEAGVTVKFNRYRRIYIGGTLLNDTGKIVADGTSDNPIIFTANTLNPSPGYFAGLYFRDSADDTSLLDYIRIEYGGYSSSADIRIDHASPTITNSIIQYSSGYGIYLNNQSSPTITNCQIINNNNYGIYCYIQCNPQITGGQISNNSSYAVYCVQNSSPTISGVTIASNSYGIYSDSSSYPVITNNTFNSNTYWPIRAYPNSIKNISNNTFLNTPQPYQGIYVYGGTLTLDSTWHYHSIPFYISGDITVQGKNGPDQITTLTIEAGVTLKFNSSAGLFIGHDTNINYPGKLIVNGTASNSVTFSRWSNSGYWDGIFFRNYASDDSSLSYCTIEYGGNAGNGAIYLNQCSPTISNTTISYSRNYGIYIYNHSDPTISNSNILNCGNHGLYINSYCSPTVTSTIIANNSGRGIYITSYSTPTISGCSINENSSYGLQIADTSSSATVQNCIFDDNDNYPIRAYARHFGNFQGNTYTNNLYQKLYVNGDTITVDSTWENAGVPYKITGDVTVYGQWGPDQITTLTLEPGVSLMFDRYVGLYIGHDSNPDYPGALVANGTSNNRITFTADTNNPSPGFWDGLYFRNYTDDDTTILNYCVIAYGGYSGNENIYCNSCSPTIRNCEIRHGSGAGVYCNNYSNPTLVSNTIHHNSSYGVYVTNSSPTIDNCNIYSNGTYGVYITGYSEPSVRSCTISLHTGSGVYIASTSSNPTVTHNAINQNNNYPITCYARHLNLMYGNTFQGNLYQKIFVRGDTISTDATWHYHPIPYLINGHVYVRGTEANLATLTIEPGVVMQWNRYYQLYIGSTSVLNPGALVANGTPEHKIIFTMNDAYSPAPGNWDGIYFYDYSDDSRCILQNVVIEYGGYSSSEGITCVNASPTLRYVEVKYCSGSGIYLSGTSSPTIFSCYIHNNSSYGIRCSGNGANPTIQYSVITDNPTGIYIAGSAQPIIGGSQGVGNNIMNNSSWGARNTTTSTCINAQYNWWGHPDGPDDDSFARDDCVNDGNDNDNANDVSDDIYYLNWLSTPINTPTQPPAPTLTPTVTPTPTATPTGQPSPTPTPTPTATYTPTSTPTPQVTNTPTFTPTPAPVPSSSTFSLILMILAISIVLIIILKRK